VLGDIQNRVKEIFEEIAENHDFEIDTLEVAEDYVHIFLSFPPKKSISKVVGMLKSISASVIFKQHPKVKKELWGREFWSKGYYIDMYWSSKNGHSVKKHRKN